ncbi:MAG: PH domain-containing protein [Planctomycetota bacterium]
MKTFTPPKSAPRLSDSEASITSPSRTPAAATPDVEADGALAPDNPAVRAATMIPAQLLQPGEIIVLLLKPHPLYIVLAPLKTLTIMALFTLLGVMLARDNGAYDLAQNIVIVGMLLIVARLFWQFLEWVSRVYVMTDQRVVTVAGVLRVRVIDTPLSNITHSELFFSLRERVFALGTLGFNTAGTAFTEAYWVMVAKPLDVHAKVVETLKRYRR